MREQNGASFFTRSIEGLAQALAWASAFLLTPPVYAASVEWVSRYMAGYIGPTLAPDLDWLVRAAWGVICAITIFQFSRATIGTALVFFGTGIALRFLS